MLLFASIFAVQAASAEAPCTDCNVLWLVMDTTRHDYVGPLRDGRSHSPNLDRLAARGSHFVHAYAQGPDTMVSVSSYMSGRYRINAGMDFSTFHRDQNFHPMAPEITTVAEVLTANGYRSIGFTSNSLIAAHKWDLGLHQGFASWTRTDDPKIAAQAIATLNEVRDEKFLLYLHLMGPHFPNARVDGFADRHPGDFPSTLPTAEGAIYQDLNRGKKVATQQEQDYLRALYADGVWKADRELGKVLDHLEALGLEKKTLVIFISDHGESLGEPVGGKPIWGHGGALRDTLLHVPMYIAGPGVPHQKVGEEQIAELVDLAPTIAGLLGIPVDDSWKWEGEPLVGPGAVQGTSAMADRGVPPKYSISVRDAGHSAHLSVAESYLVYGDLRSSPGETEWCEPTEVHRALGARAQQYWDTRHPPSADGALDAPDEELLEQLQQLGYMSDE